MMHPIRVIACAVAVAAPLSRAMAHGGGAEGESDAAWRIAVALPLILAGGAYFRGVRRVWHRAGAGRGVTRTQALACGAGLLVLATMLVLPLHAWGRLRFTPHMIEHELLTLVAAPLLAAGGAGVPWLFALPLSWRRYAARWITQDGPRRLWRGISHPAAAWALHGLALWVWHAPALFEAALRSEVIHYLQHVSLLATSLLFWTSILPRRPDSRTRIAGVFSLFATTLHATLLGALLTVSPNVWYASYAAGSGLGGLSALEDQQLAGLVMWVPGGLVYVGAALALSAALLREDDPAARRRRASVAGG